MESENIKTYLTRLLTAVLVVGMVGGFAYGVFKYAKAINLFGLEKVVVSGASLIPNEKVLEYTDLEFGRSLFDLPLDSIQQQISQNPFVLAAQASRQFPRTLFIEVHEREPIAYINHSEFSCVDEYGYIMPLPPAGLTLEMPILSGFTEDDTIKTGGVTGNRRVQHMVEVLTEIHKIYPQLYPEISELVAAGQQYTLYTADSATRVYLGENDLHHKVRLLETFWDTIGQKRTWADYEYIDLRYKKQIIVRERT
ncbi:MAG: Cell division protein FtsQ [Candidatus Marinimicrobia bacterium]|nr:Cell division protein FtsQ [Candidatus Neomarinimicrobiota bacterium]